MHPTGGDGRDSGAVRPPTPGPIEDVVWHLRHKAEAERRRTGYSFAGYALRRAADELEQLRAQVTQQQSQIAELTAAVAERDRRLALAREEWLKLKRECGGP